MSWDVIIVKNVKRSFLIFYILIYTETAGVKTYYHQNAHGDVILLTDGMGNILKTYEYDAFGREWDALDTDNNPFRYCGEYFDKQTETVYLRARYYDSAYGRFTQQDGWEYVNFGDPLSLNLYTYCWNNPVMYADPSGNDAIYVVDYDYNSGVPVVVHAIVLIEVADGSWYEIEFTGANKKEAQIYIENKGNDLDIILTDERYNNRIYIEGDFTKSYEYAVECYNEDKYYGGYNLFGNNCLHFVQSVLREGEANDKVVQEYLQNSKTIIPSVFYKSLKKIAPKDKVNHRYYERVRELLEKYRGGR